MKLSGASAVRLARNLTCVAALAAASILGGCQQQGDGQAPAWSPLKRSAAGSPGGAKEVKEGYGVLLQVFTNPASHAEDANYYKTQTERLAKWEGLFIVTKGDHSELYWGRFPTMEAAAETLKTAKAYRSPAGIAVYPQALVVPLGGEDVGPAEWNLSSAPGDYTVVVAVFYDLREAKYFGRKQNAVEYCRQLRDQGHDAYYHHGPSQSTVSVGAFPASAVKKVVTEEAVRLDILDPRVDLIVKQFKQLAVNGYSEKRTVVDPATGMAKQVTAEPYLAHIPGKSEGE